MLVDALDLCYTKSHVDTFVIISGDSDLIADLTSSPRISGPHLQEAIGYRCLDNANALAEH